MSISIVIPIYIGDEHLKQLTRDCLFSIQNMYDELIIIDDSSPLKSSEFMSVADKFMMNFENQGYIKSANKGISSATKDFIILVCNDTKLLRGSLKDLCNKGYTFPTIQDKDKPFWDGALYGFPRSIGGLYDERFHTYFGDLDKFYTAKQKGIQLKQTNKVDIWHQQSATTNFLEIRQSQYAKDYQAFKDKWGFDPLNDYYNLI